MHPLNETNEPNERFVQLTTWLCRVLKLPAVELLPLAGDASFRRYFRLLTARRSYVVMDAPPAKESCVAFVKIAGALSELGIRTPEIHESDLEQGFLLLTDFGNNLYFNELRNSKFRATNLYEKALETLLKMQQCKTVADYKLPHYDAQLLRCELELFDGWYLTRHLSLKLSASELDLIHSSYELLINSALQQPQRFVHRDYHSRNLLLLDNGEVGVLDFQDAVLGPVSYDAVSLLRDCYINWPTNQVKNWALRYFEQAIQQGLVAEADFDRCWRWFDWMSLQRHLKCVGIFARLAIRDQKLAYLAEMPRVMSYMIEVCSRYEELNELGVWLKCKQ